MTRSIAPWSHQRPASLLSTIELLALPRRPMMLVLSVGRPLLPAKSLPWVDDAGCGRAQSLCLSFPSHPPLTLSLSPPPHAHASLGLVRKGWWPRGGFCCWCLMGEITQKLVRIMRTKAPLPKSFAQAHAALASPILYVGYDRVSYFLGVLQARPGKRNHLRSAVKLKGHHRREGFHDKRDLGAVLPLCLLSLHERTSCRMVTLWFEQDSIPRHYGLLTIF